MFSFRAKMKRLGEKGGARWRVVKGEKVLDFAVIYCLDIFDVFIGSRNIFLFALFEARRRLVTKDAAFYVTTHCPDNIRASEAHELKLPFFTFNFCLQLKQPK